MKLIPKILITSFASMLLTFGLPATYAHTILEEKIISTQQETKVDLELRTKIYEEIYKKSKESFEWMREDLYEFSKKENLPTEHLEKENFYLGSGFGFKMGTPEYNLIILARKFKDGYKTLTIQAEYKKTKEVITMTDIDVDGDVDETERPILEKEKKFDYFLRLAEEEMKTNDYSVFSGRDDVDYYLFD